MEAIPEGETELEAARVSSLLDEYSERVNVFIEHMLLLTILVPVPERESSGLSRVKGKNSTWKSASKDVQSMKLFTPPGYWNTQSM